MSKQVKYIGMDVHKAMTVIAVLDAGGKVRAEATIETETGAIVQFLRGAGRGLAPHLGRESVLGLAL